MKVSIINIDVVGAFKVHNLPAILSLTQENGKSVLFGITSKGIGCGQALNPGPIFADVFSVIDFVKDILVRSITSLSHIKNLAYM